MKLEIGKTYYSRAGGPVQVVARRDGVYTCLLQRNSLPLFYNADGTLRGFEHCLDHSLRELKDPLAARFIALWLTGRIATHDGPGRVMIRVAQPEGGLYRERWEATTCTLDEAFTRCGV